MLTLVGSCLHGRGSIARYLGPPNFRGGRMLCISPSAFVIVCDHYWMCGPGTNNSAGVVGHGEMNMEPNSLAMVTTVTGDTQRKDNGTRREAEHFRTVELNNVERLSCAIGRSICGLGRVRVKPLRAHTLCQFSGDTLCLRRTLTGSVNEAGEMTYFTNLTTGTTGNARMRGRCACYLHSEL